MRLAIYLTPPEGSPLAVAAEAWLGRSAFTGAEMRPRAPAEANPAVPARYGFHATLKAPFRLTDGIDEAAVRAAFADFAAARPPVTVALTLSRISRFVALTAVDHRPVSAACDAAVEAFEPFRAPLGVEERARRRPEKLSERERELLDAWGYPHVFERFLFHMTLSGPVDEDAMDGVMDAARAAFAPFEGVPQRLLYALYREETPGGAFSIVDTQAEGALP